MGQYVRLGGVKTWYEEAGAGEPLVLLHGGFSDAGALALQRDAFAPHFHVYLPERRGHGHTPDVPGPLTYQAMADDTIAFLETVVGGPARLVGHSDGANVGLLVAQQRPELVERLVSVSANFHHDGLIPGVIDPDSLGAYLGDHYASLSPDGREHLPVIVAKLARMWREEPTLTLDDLRGIRPRTLVMAGDDDAVKSEHTLALYEALPNAELAVVPGTSHVLLMEKPALCNALMLDFLTRDAVPTYVPVRRAARP